MKQYITLFVFLLSLTGFAQHAVTGKVTDDNNGEPLIGAVVVADSGKTVTTTDLDGNYKLMLKDGVHSLQVKILGYTHNPVLVTVAGKAVVLDLKATNATLKEVEIVADVAIDRKTPVAFSNIGELKIKEEGGNRDITMLINSTPGAYATEQGGGSGDSRVNIRGVDQRSVAVMVDGVPVNDMENGAVFWSNWDGLGDVTRSMQVQRGLGASRLALPSVGGTINILTRGIDQKKSFGFRTEYGNNGASKLSFGFNSGEFGKGWGVTLAGSRKTGQGWVDQTWVDAWSYFIKIQRRAGNHLFSLGANGAPQQHGQRSFRIPIGIYDREYAEKLGVNVDSLYSSGTGYTTLTQGERGLRYNSHWGYVNFNDGQTGEQNERINFYHKPQFNFSHFWNPKPEISWSTVLYLSLGNGGGTSTNSTLNRDTATGLLNYTQYYNSNVANIDALYSTTLSKSTRYLQASMNNHFWYGGISTFTWKPEKEISFMFGVDARHYEGYHYRKVYDLLGGDYMIDGSNRNQPNGIGNLSYSMKGVGDTIAYNYTGFVDWGGLFAQGEYVHNDFAVFLTVTGSMTAYKRVDYFKRRDIVTADSIYAQTVGYNEVLYVTPDGTGYVAQNGSTITTSGDTTFINNLSGQDYTLINATSYAWASDASRFAETKKKYFPGYTVKTGVNYNWNDHLNTFLNMGYMNLAPRFNTVFDNNNREYPGIKNQFIYAVELGTGYRSKYFGANVNLYYTIWKNRPPQFNPTITIAGDVFTYDLIGLSTTTRGVELDFNWKPFRQLQVEGVVSLGDWIYNSAGTVYLYDQAYELVDTIDYSAEGVHIGDAAQTQFSLSARYSPVKGLWMRARYTWFANYYASFDPILLSNVYDSNGNIIGSNRDRESWKMPSYGLLDMMAGYEYRDIKVGENDRQVRVGFNLAVFNVLNTVYISDAQNGNLFNASTALVYMGMGRRWTVGMNFSF